MNLPGYGDPATWPACTGNPNDPRSEDDGREEWESFVAFVDIIDEAKSKSSWPSCSAATRLKAKADLEKTVEAHYRKWLVDQERQAEEDRAADLAESRALAREAA